MTKEIKVYRTRDLMKEGKRLMHTQKFRPLHTNFINNDESQGYEVTFVNGLDDPHNDPALVKEREQERTNQARKEELETKRDLTIIEMRELLRLSL